MKYFLFCDFATVSFDRSFVAKTLEENEIKFFNLNNYLWELETPQIFEVPIATGSEIIYCYFARYLDKNSVFLVVKADEYCSNQE